MQCWCPLVGGKKGYEAREKNVIHQCDIQNILFWQEMEMPSSIGYTKRQLKDLLGTRGGLAK